MIQVVKYKCCGSVFAACVEPDCYTDDDWLKNLKEYVKRGDKVEMIEDGTLQFGKCKCKEIPKVETPNLFNIMEKQNNNETPQKNFNLTQDELLDLLKEAYRHGYSTYEMVDSGLDTYDADGYARWAILGLKLKDK